MIKNIVMSIGTSLLVSTAIVATDDSGIKMANGFTASIYADNLGNLRHLAEGPDGWIYAALSRPKVIEEEGKPSVSMGGVAFRDSDGDGKAETVKYFAKEMRGTGMAVRGGYLYFGARREIVRWKLSAEGLPSGEKEVIVHGMPRQRQHAAKSIAISGDGKLFVNVGAPSNACMVEGRTKGSPGRVPCDILEKHGGIWQFDADKPGQEHMTDGVLYATGVRNAIAIAWNKSAKDLYLVMHGRDQLHSFFPELFDTVQNADLPAEEFHRVKKHADIGWPYTYYDGQKNARMVMPEYGGDGETVSDNTDFQAPLVAFPGHWAPNSVMFIENDKSSIEHGALIAFHGSWNRGPEKQAEGQLVYVPMSAEGEVTGDWQVIASGFGGAGFTGPSDAEYRPTGLLEAKDGSIYVSSGKGGGRVWKISYATE